jgi:excisionase family DNA binding protein
MKSNYPRGSSLGEMSNRLTKCRLIKRRQLAYSIEELARQTGLSRSTIYEEIREGHLEKTKIRGRTVITYENAMKWLRG